MTLLILADDLTGAADSAARCHHAGLNAHVYLTPPTGALPDGAVAFSTDSRFLAPTEAAAQVRQWLAAFPEPENAQWYKKIDSTLRGNIGAELDAMLETLFSKEVQPCAVICPAFPAQGRGLADGFLVYGQTTALTLHLPTLLVAQTSRTVAAIALADVRAGVAHLAEKMATVYQQGAQLLVVDAMTEDDLVNLLAAAQQALPHALLCGSAGLIEPLARQRARNLPRTVIDDNKVMVHKPMVAVIGSGSQMAHRQLAALRQDGHVHCVEMQPGAITGVVMTPGADLALHLPQPVEQAVLEGENARSFVVQLTQTALEWIKRLKPQTLLIVGGDTAVHLLRALGIEHLTIVAELMPGIPLAVGDDAWGQRRTIVTKAGNFGNEETLIHLFKNAQ